MEYVDYIENEGTGPFHVRRSLKDRSDPLVEFDDAEFVNRFRLNKLDVIDLHDNLSEFSMPPVTNRGLPIPFMMKLLVTLHFYATGMFHRENADLLGISESSTCRIVRQTTKAICYLRPQYIKFPDGQYQSRKCKLDFFLIANFPDENRNSQEIICYNLVAERFLSLIHI